MEYIWQKGPYFYFTSSETTIESLKDGLSVREEISSRSKVITTTHGEARDSCAIA